MNSNLPKFKLTSVRETLLVVRPSPAPRPLDLLVRPLLSSSLGFGAIPHNYRPFFLTPIRSDRVTTTVPDNTLSSEERRVGWRLLFDGRTSAGWRGFREKSFPACCWAIEDGSITRRRTGSEELYLDLITTEQFDNFQLEFDWRITPGGNSGVKYLVQEDRPAGWEKAYMDYEAQALRKSGLKESEISARLNPAQWSHMAMGFELQLIDDVLNEDAQGPANRRTGALYDLMAPLQSPARPAGKFNHARITVHGRHIEHWINGVKVLEFQPGSTQMEALIKQSKFEHLVGFGLNSKGHIALQDHGDEVWFKNIKVLPNP